MIPLLNREKFLLQDGLTGTISCKRKLNPRIVGALYL